MAKTTYEKNWETDALTEVFNIGAGHAATALSQLLDRKVMISVPKVEMVPLADLRDALGGAENRVTAVYIMVLGTVTGNMLFVLPHESATHLASVLRGRAPGRVTLSSNDSMIIKQAGVVTMSSYLSALTRFLDIPLIPSAASIANDMAGAVLDTVAAEIGECADYGLLVQTEFIDESAHIGARLCFLPDPHGQEIILKKLRVW